MSQIQYVFTNVNQIEDCTRFPTDEKAIYGISLEKVSKESSTYSVLLYTELMPLMYHFTVETPAELVERTFFSYQQSVAFAFDDLLRRVNLEK